MRRYSIIILFFFILPFTGFSQYDWDYGAKLGGANYLGSIGGLDTYRQNFVVDMKLQETRWNIGGYCRYRIRDPWFVEAQLNWVRVEGADSLTKDYAPRQLRNLTFRNDIIQFNALGEWAFFENPDLGNTYRYENSFSMFICTGFSIFYQDPYAYNPFHYFGEGTWVNLHGLRTEADLYNQTFHLIQPGIPFGAGFNFTINKQYRIGWSITWTKTFTDFMDGASGDYPSAAEWATLTPEEQYFSDRSTAAYIAYEQSKGVNTEGVTAADYGPPTGSQTILNQRGGKLQEQYYNYATAPTDSFITTTVDLGYVIRGTSSFTEHARYQGLMSKNKYKVRRRRAKF